MRYYLTVLAVLITANLVRAQFTCVKGDCISGHGVCVFPSGARYEGEFKKGKIHGLGTLHFANGHTYIGHWHDQKRHGRGRFRFAGGDEYLGDFHANAMEGQGVMTYANGNRYEGNWRNNQPHGQGTYEFANGNRYVGYFVEGKFHGKGTMYYVDGSKYQGQWKDNLRHGEGVLTRADGTVKSGYWEEDELMYAGPVLTEEERAEARARDETFAKIPQLRNCNIEYCAEGRGEYHYADGTHYVGTFAQGKPVGKGTVRFANGNRYDGEWAQHAPHGRGTMYYANGRILRAEWERGRPVEILLTDEEKPPMPEKGTGDHKNDIDVWAVVIGASQYRHMQSLKYTDDDAYQLFAFLKSPHGGAVPDEQIRLLVDEDATRTNILSAMRQTFSQADENDVIFFYFSGHGVQGAFLPVDYDGFNNTLMHEEVRDVIDQSPARHKLVIADACHAGSLFIRRTPAHQILERYYQAFENTGGGMALLMSSKGEEFSLEDNGLRAGVFSYYLIRAMKGAADNDYNGIVTVQETYRYVRRNVQIYTGYVQTPLLMGDFDSLMPISVVRE